MKHLLTTLLFLTLLSTLSACTNMKAASKSSTSLTNFLGFSELPDWYIRSKYSYPDSNWIDNDFGLPIHYRDVGEGPVIVMVHGEFSSLHVWDSWIEGLQDEYRVIALDLPGSGLTSAPHCLDDPEDTCEENLTHDYLAHTLKYFIEDLKLSRFTLVGSSYGGYLAANYALENKDNVEKLILVSPMGFQQETPGILDYLTLPGTDLLNQYIQPSTVVTSVLNNFYAAKELLTLDTIRRYIHLNQSEGSHESNVRQLKLVRKLMEEGTTSPLNEIEVPTMILWGEDDEWGSYEHAKLWQDEITDAILVNYAFVGHMSMEETPDNTIPDLKAFLVDDAIPTLIGLGGGSTFTIQDAASEFDKESLFNLGPLDSSEDEPTDSTEESTESVMEDIP